MQSEVYVGRLFVGNFDFEIGLIERTHPPPIPLSVRRICADLASVWLAVAEDEDCVWTSEELDREFAEELVASGLPRVRFVSRESDVPAAAEFCPWGWTGAVRGWAERSGWRIHAPAQEVVRAANSRRFSWALEKEWGVGLDRSTLITATGDLEAALRSLPPGCRQWVLKAEFGMSARERLLGSGREITAAMSGWLRKRLRAGTVVLEPWVERLDEVGLQFEIPVAGEPQLVGIAPLLSGPAGEYRGSRFHPDPMREQQWSDAVVVCRQAAARLQSLGYFGPAGFDAMCYRDHEGRTRLRPLQDINARWTMGRLALGFRRLLPQGRCGSWLHANLPRTTVERNREWLQAARAVCGAGTRLIPTSPAAVGGQPAGRQAVLLLAGSREELLAAEAHVEGRFRTASRTGRSNAPDCH